MQINMQIELQTDRQTEAVPITYDPAGMTLRGGSCAFGEATANLSVQQALRFTQKQPRFKAITRVRCHERQK